MCNVFICILHLIVQSKFTQNKHFLTLNLSKSECSHVVSLLTDDEQKKVAGGVFYTFATCASLVYELINTDCWAQNGSTHGGVLGTFKCEF